VILIDQEKRCSYLHPHKSSSVHYSLLSPSPSPTHAKIPQNASLHILHRLILELLLLRRPLAQPLLAFLLNLLLKRHILRLTPLADLVPQHLIPIERLFLDWFSGTRIDQLWLVALPPQRAREASYAGFLPILALCLPLLVELLTEELLSSSELGWDECAFEGLEDGSSIVEAHGGEVFKEGDKLNEGLIVGVAVPFGKDDGVFGLVFYVVGVRIDDQHFAQRPVEIGQVLRFALAVIQTEL
jgi:hypothetical protein